jgi:hypothetical protein
MCIRLDCELRLASNVLWNPILEVRLIEQRLLVGLILNLVDQDVLGPAELLRPLKVELALAESLQRSRITKLVQQFLAPMVRVFIAGVGFVELFDSPQVSSGEAANARKLGAGDLWRDSQPRLASKSRPAAVGR